MARLTKAQRALLTLLNAQKDYKQLAGREVRTALALYRMALIDLVKFARLHLYTDRVQWEWYEAAIIDRGRDALKASR